MTKALEVEDSLQEAGVYRNMNNDRVSHMDSYGTLTDYTILSNWWEQHKKEYSLEEWKEMAEYWHSKAYLSPNSSQLAFFVERRLTEWR